MRKHRAVRDIKLKKEWVDTDVLKDLRQLRSKWFQKQLASTTGAYIRLCGKTVRVFLAWLNGYGYCTRKVITPTDRSPLNIFALRKWMSAKGVQVTGADIRQLVTNGVIRGRYERVVCYKSTGREPLSTTQTRMGWIYQGDADGHDPIIHVSNGLLKLFSMWGDGLITSRDKTKRPSVATNMTLKKLRQVSKLQTILAATPSETNIIVEDETTWRKLQSGEISLETIQKGKHAIRSNSTE